MILWREVANYTERIISIIRNKYKSYKMQTYETKKEKEKEKKEKYFF